MAAPTDPTLTGLVTEAYNLAGIDSPTAAQLARGEDIWAERVKNAISIETLRTGNMQLKTLQTSDIDISVIGSNVYTPPSNFLNEFSISILSGDFSGTAQSGGSKQITLSASETVTEADAVGKYLLVTGGTGENEYKQILTYNETTKVATFADNWSTQPDSTSTYLVVNTITELNKDNQLDYKSVSSVQGTGKPSRYSIYNDVIYFDKPCDALYGIELLYYANLNMVNLTEGSSTLITKIYRNWQVVLQQGLYVEALRDMRAPNVQDEMVVFKSLVANLLLTELPYGGEFEGFEL